jgi:hypothetical protein
MRKALIAAVALAALASSWSLGATPASADTAATPAAADVSLKQQVRAAMLEAHIAGMKAGLALTAEQEKNWAPFEAAIRAAAAAREEGWRRMRERMSGGERPSPIERMRQISERLSKASDALTKIADAGKPLYDSLTDEQKRVFGPLLRDFIHHGRSHSHMGGGAGGMQ